jgi:hypothetical protein
MGWKATVSDVGSGGQSETPFIDIPTPGAGEVREEQPQTGNTTTT